MAKRVPLTRGFETTVSDRDFERVTARKWYAHRYGNGQTYAARKAKGAGGLTLLHRWLVDAPKGAVVDHVDGNPLNNQRRNLRVCTQQENTWNRVASKRSASGVKGVSQCARTGKWRAFIRRDRKNVALGTFDSIEKAAAAYQAAAESAFGKFTRKKSKS